MLLQGFSLNSMTPNNSATERSAWHVFIVFLTLGLTSFGGPAAHLSHFRDELVIRRRWLSEQRYADLVALCQFLPGPASSQVGIALGLYRSGYAGALAAWLGFTLPSAFALILLALGMQQYNNAIGPGALQGLKIVAVAVVLQAIWGMSKSFCTDALRISIMVATASVVLLLPSAFTQIAVLLAAALLGILLFKPSSMPNTESVPLVLNRTGGIFWLLLFFALLLLLPLLAALYPQSMLLLIDKFYRVGALVFGGGHVVLPLLEQEIVANHLMSKELFLAGYGATQAVPGPLFTFSAFLGAVIPTSEPAWLTGLICLTAIFLPSFFFVFGALPFWEILRSNRYMQQALIGVNAAVVGLLLAALYQPIWSTTILSAQDFTFGMLAFIALMFWKLPPWLVVLSGALIGYWVL